jgi:ribosomal-protein-alanine N-acetyltransferase
VGSVFIKKNNQFIGKAALFYYISTTGIKHDIEMSCILQEKYWNKGYATEISKKLIECGFIKLHISKLTALTRPYNIKSQYILEKIGMRYVRNIQAEEGDFLLYEITS